MARKTFARGLLMVLALAGAAQADPLQRPARESALAAQRQITGLAAVGPARLVAVGQRGHLLLSDDAGAHWKQSPLPISSDLTAVQFVTSQKGFAVGHDGVVLTSDDGGQQWHKLLDGKALNELVLNQLQAQPASAERDRLLAEARRNLEAGSDKPLLDLYFSTEQEGFVVGAYNLLARTRDGGKTWESWYDRSDNTDKLFNLYAIRAHKGGLFIAGEGGVLMRLDAVRQRFVRLQTGYQGSFFGLLDAGEALIAHGMRGNALISRDSGTTWTAMQTGLQGSITASTRGPDGSLWLVDQLGRVVRSRDGGASFQPVNLPAGLPLAAVQATANTLVLAGARGVRGLPMPKE